MRKEIIKKGIAILLSLVVIAGPIGGLTVFGASLGDNLYSKSLFFGEKTVLANGVYWNSNANDKITENYIEYKPGGPVLPIITHGNDIYGAASFRAVVAKAKLEGKHVIGGINGDFFDMSTGVPLGMTIKDGILLTSENSLHPSVGFYSDGSAIISRAELNIRLDGPALGTGIAHLHLNKVVTKVSGLMVYTTVFGDDNTNKAGIPTYNILLDINSGEPRINSTMEATVSEIIEATGAVQIPQGKILLTMAAETVYPGTLSKLKTLQAGDEVTLSFPANQSWDQVVYGIGGGNRLVSGGVNVAPKGSEVNPHTAMGIKADGSIIFYTVDGRQSGHSKGTTLSQLAERMIELGCIDAINLDGGGSTALHSIYPGDSTLTTINSPSQTSLRNCANYILLVNTAPPTERLGHIHLYPYDLQMLAGATQKFTVKATDENYYPVEAPTDLTYSTSGKIGSFDDDGIFTAGTTAGTGEAIAKYSSQIFGTAKISVVSKPDSVSIINKKDGQALTDISVIGGDSIALSGRAIYRKMPLVAQSQCFNWTVEGDIGTIDKNGNFTAANITGGNGRIIASAGGTTASITVNVVSEGEQVETFEGTSHVLQSQPKAGLSVDLNKDLTKVRYGYQSAEIKYDFKAGGTNKISIPSAITFTKSPSTLNFWVYGDGSGNTLKLNVETPEGPKEIIGTLLDFTGWKLVVAKLPEGISAVSGLELTATGNNTGTIYLDQIICGFGHYVDQQPPAIQMSLNGRALTATIKDAIDNGLSSADIKLTYDGKPITFSYNSGTKALNATIPASDGLIHRVTIMATDKSGNIQRKGLTVPGGDSMAQPFIDMNSHWAKLNTAYLYNRGIVNGVKTDGGFKYIPDTGITRSEFAVIMSKWLNTDMSLYKDMALPFTDNASIPSWALDSVKAMYGMGIIQGTASGGKLYFKPNGAISREEVMTIIGRTQARGYAEADLSSFGDGNQVSSWSLPYVKTLVEQGIISGYSGKLWPKDSVTRAQVATMIFSLY